MKIYFVRHGHPNYELDCLTPLGHRQAEAAAEENSLAVGEIRLEKDGRRVFLRGTEINLTAKEFDLLELLMTKSKPLSRFSLFVLILIVLWLDMILPLVKILCRVFH